MIARKLGLRMSLLIIIHINMDQLLKLIFFITLLVFIGSFIHQLQHPCQKEELTQRICLLYVE